MITWIAAASCLLALIPAALFLRNLALYALLPPPGSARAKCSVLIPLNYSVLIPSQVLHAHPL